jgi:hypothetical protein
MLPIVLSDSNSSVIGNIMLEYLTAQFALRELKHSPGAVVGSKPKLIKLWRVRTMDI